MTAVYLTCFVLGFLLSVLSAFSGLGRLHFGHFRVGHVHLHPPSGSAPHFSALNGFTLPAFLCWFGGAGYLLQRYSPVIGALVLVLAVSAGVIGAGILYAALFKLLLPRERVLTDEETRMDGVVARVSDEIRAGGAVGEILFSQAEGRRGAAARSESGESIARGTEVVVLRYVRGIAYVSPLEELVTKQEPS